ncbi:hypothetical protein LIER_25743 [Lithospermum erythrorhizon]|uniref:Uncharacterized protein n=1 Tax=Lithospermum erythrorhizon TaxID=34254 RepID=A0AAV3R7E8_LITER
MELSITENKGYVPSTPAASYSKAKYEIRMPKEASKLEKKEVDAVNSKTTKFSFKTKKVNRPIDKHEQDKPKTGKEPSVTHSRPMGAVTWRYPIKREVVFLERTRLEESHFRKQPHKLVHKSYWKRVSPPTEQKTEQYHSLHITVEEGELLPEDATNAPPGLEEDVKITVDELKEVNLGIYLLGHIKRC